MILALAAGTARGQDSKPFDAHSSPARLDYIIHITAQAHTGNDRVWSKTAIDRRLEGHLRLAGQRTDMARLDNAQEQMARVAPARQALAADMPAIERIADECGEDEACATALMMKLVNGLPPQKRQALVSVSRGPAAKLSRHSSGQWVLDGRTACSIHATTRAASSYRSLDQGEGYATYVSGAVERHGEGDNDCRHDPVPQGSATWSGDNGLLDMQLPGLSLAERWKDQDGKTGTGRLVIPDVKLDRLHWSGRGAQSGQQTRHLSIATDRGDVPATMTIRWTFSPEA